MAGFNERFSAANKWYDPDGNPEELHDDLRRDYMATYRHASVRPSVRRHMKACETCQTLSLGHPRMPAPVGARKRLKLVINAEQMHQLLRLPPDFEIVHMFADNDPNTVSVLVAGEGLPEADVPAETPVAHLQDFDNPGTA